MALPHQAAQGCLGDTWQGGQAPLACHPPSWVALEVAEGTGCLPHPQACHGCQSPLPPCQGGPALSQQNWKVFHGHLLY